MARILIVGEDEIQRTNLIKVLQSDGHECVEAENGARALGLLLTRHIEVVVTDLDLPVISGIQLLGYMSEHNILHRSVVIVMTDEQKAGVRTMAHKAGAYALVHKPIEYTDLRIMVAQAQMESVYPRS